jgi:hypothetical protein
VLQAKERAPTFYASDVFTLGSHLNLSNSLGMHHYVVQNVDVNTPLVLCSWYE